MSYDLVQFSCLEEKFDTSFFYHKETRVKCNSVSSSRVHNWNLVLFDKFGYYSRRCYISRPLRLCTAINAACSLQGRVLTQHPSNWMHYGCGISSGVIGKAVIRLAVCSKPNPVSGHPAH